MSPRHASRLDDHLSTHVSTSQAATMLGLGGKSLQHGCQDTAVLGPVHQHVAAGWGRGQSLLSMIALLVWNLMQI